MRKIPTILYQARCQGTDADTHMPCRREAVWFVDLAKGDETYTACDEHANEIERFERSADWVEYARNERK